MYRVVVKATLELPDGTSKTVESDEFEVSFGFNCEDISVLYPGRVQNL